jgi:hypothetical protein
MAKGMYFPRGLVTSSGRNSHPLVMMQPTWQAIRNIDAEQAHAAN